MPTEKKDVRDLLHRHGIAPNAHTIAQIWGRRGIACLVFEIAPEYASGPQSLGWDGIEAVFELTSEAATNMAQALQTLAPDDVAAIRWLTCSWAERPYRLLVFIHQGTLLLNYVMDQGFSLEPGTQDHEWQS